MPSSFALVTYIPDPLGSFLDQLRKELVPGYASHAHVTVLYPRPLRIEPTEAMTHIRARILEVTPFEIEAAGVAIFPRTSVIYIAVGAGQPELVRLHEILNRGPLGFEEPFPYHPHITLAQELPPDQVERAFLNARSRWAEFSGSRKFTAHSLTLVENATDNNWIDLAEYKLGVRSGEERGGA